MCTLEEGSRRSSVWASHRDAWFVATVRATSERVDCHDAPVSLTSSASNTFPTKSRSFTNSLQHDVSL